MNIVAIMVISGVLFFPASVITQELDQLEDPDEYHYFDQLLEKMFSPFSIYTADSLALIKRGYSASVTSLILGWQNESGAHKDAEWLLKHLRGADKALLVKDLKMPIDLIRISLRQRIQYAPAQQGWRILNKGHVWNRFGHANFLLEQDPGETRLSDHAVFTFSSGVIPGFDNLILGDFQVNWGGGLILNQSGYRMNLNPRSIMHKKQLAIRPHYSVREIKYYRGIAGTFSRWSTQGSVFISRRKLLGAWKGGQFIEDSDGIHPAGKRYERHYENVMGIALERKFHTFRLFSAMLVQPEESTTVQYELGLSNLQVSPNSFEFFLNSLDPNNQRILFNWMYTSKPIMISIQYRLYRTVNEISTGIVPTTLGTSATNETGIAVRAQLRPLKNYQIRFTLETGNPATTRSVWDYRQIKNHKLQVIKRYPKGVVQVDYNLKTESSLISGSIWEGAISELTLIKSAISVNHHLSSSLNFRMNLKSAFQNDDTGVLLQQRLSGAKQGWQWSVGYTRFTIPAFAMRLSIYETSLAESFAFFTAYDDGERWFIYLKHNIPKDIQLEFKLNQTRSFNSDSATGGLSVSFQFSINL